MILKYLQLPYFFEPKHLQKELAALQGHAWQLHYQKLHYEGEWTALPLRSIGGNAENVMISPVNDQVYEDTVFLKESPYLAEVLANFKCPLLAVRLLKLNAGALIKEHRDADLCFELGEIRLHIPVITHAEVECRIDKERVYLKEGECWYLNFNLPHSIHNKSGVNRVHLVIDALVNDWVKELFCRPGLYKKEINDLGHPEEVKIEMIARLRQINSETSNRMANEMEASFDYLNKSIWEASNKNQDDQ